jgi:hypothetical protein
LLLGCHAREHLREHLLRQLSLLPINILVLHALRFALLNLFLEGCKQGFVGEASGLLEEGQLVVDLVLQAVEALEASECKHHTRRRAQRKKLQGNKALFFFWEWSSAALGVLDKDLLPSFDASRDFSKVLGSGWVVDVCVHAHLPVERPGFNGHNDLPPRFKSMKPRDTVKGHFRLARKVEV